MKLKTYPHNSNYGSPPPVVAVRGSDRTDSTLTIRRTGGMNTKVILACLVIIFGVAFNHFFRNIRRAQLPSHLLNHTALWIPDFVPQEHFDSLNAIIRDMAEFPSNIDADLKTGGFVAQHEHIGEAEPIGEGGKCNHPFLVPNLDKTLCILPQRVDIGRHFVLTGGPDAIRESYEKMISRLTSFGRYMFNVVDMYPTVQSLFNEDSFQAAAKSICPPDEQVLDPFQFNFIIQVKRPLPPPVPLHCSVCLATGCADGR